MSLRDSVTMTQSDTKYSMGASIDPVLNAEIKNYGSSSPVLASSAGVTPDSEKPVQTVGTNYAPGHSAINYNTNNQIKVPNNGLSELSEVTLKRIAEEEKESSSKKDFSTILYLVFSIAAFLIIKKIFF